MKRFEFIAVFFAVLLLQCTWNTLKKKEMEDMKAAYALRYGRGPDLWPVMVGMHGRMIDIFSVPVDNAVATNSFNNAITLLRFRGDEIAYDELRRDFIDGVGSGNKYYPGLFSDEWIGYTQTRGFLLFNVKNGAFADHIPLKSGDEYFTGVSAFNPEMHQFLFQVRDDRYLESKRFLRLLQFDCKGGFSQISEFDAGPHSISFLEPWAIQNKTVFIYNNDSIRIDAYDKNFTPVSHPFCDLFNNLKEFRCLDQLTMHPTLPLAVLVEIKREARDGYKAYLVNWTHHDPEKRYIELFWQEISIFSESAQIKSMSVSDFQFSPDGRWLVFRDESEEVLQRTPSPTFMAMPVDGGYDMPFGRPMVLGKVLRKHARPSSTAWIEKPLSFVVSDGAVLYKWELENLPREFFK